MSLISQSSLGGLFLLYSLLSKPVRAFVGEEQGGFNNRVVGDVPLVWRPHEVRPTMG